MREVNQYSGVKSFDASLQLMMVSSGDIRTFNGEIIGHLKDPGKLIPYMNSFMALDSLNRAFFVGKDRAEQFLPEDRIAGYSSMYLSTYNKKANTYGIFSVFDQEKIIEGTEYIGRDIFGEYVFSGIGTSEFIVARHIPTNKVLSKFPLSSLGKFRDGATDKAEEVMEFSGTMGNVLVCSMASGAILLLDFVRGVAIKYITEAQTRVNVSPIKAESSIFRGLSHSTFIEIDVANPSQMVKVDLTDQLKSIKNIPADSPNWLFIRTTAGAGDFIYFGADKDILGRFDTKSKRIVEHQVMSSQRVGAIIKKGNENFQIGDNRVYMLDSTETLHEFDF